MKGFRKPAPEAYEAAVCHLRLPPSQLIFVDDRAVNVDAAKQAGIDGILFKSAAQLEEQLKERGLRF